MSAPPTYLKRRKLGWYVQLAVPLRLQAAMGAKVLTRSLRTRDEGEALRLRFPVIAELQRLISQAAPAAPLQLTPEGILGAATRARAAVDAGELTLADAMQSLEVTRDDFLEEQARKLGVDAEGHPRVSPEAVATIRRAHHRLSVNPELTLGFQADKYMLAREASQIRRQTVEDTRRHLECFTAWVDRDTPCKSITKARASKYADEVVMPRKRALQTKRAAITEVRQFFDWLEARGAVPFNPFAKTGKLLKQSTRGKQQARRPWTGDEVLKVLRKIKQSDPMWPLVALGAFTGARREDLCDAQIDAVEGNVLVIREGKTAAAVRRVPLHPMILPLVKQLAKASTDGYLLPGLLTGGSDDKRGHYIGKRLNRVIRQAGVVDKRVVFHSFRNSVLTQMEAAGVQHSLRQQIVGHEKDGSVTDVVYTADADDARCAEAIAHVTYGADVDDLVRTAGASLKITHVSRRRGKVGAKS